LPCHCRGKGNYIGKCKCNYVGNGGKNDGNVVEIVCKVVECCHKSRNLEEAMQTSGGSASMVKCLWEALDNAWNKGYNIGMNKGQNNGKNSEGEIQQFLENDLCNSQGLQSGGTKWRCDSNGLEEANGCTKRCEENQWSQLKGSKSKGKSLGKINECWRGASSLAPSFCWPSATWARLRS